MIYLFFFILYYGFLSFFFFFQVSSSNNYLSSYTIKKSICSYDFELRIFFLTYFLVLDVLQKNAMIGGAVTGAVISAVTNNGRDKIVTDAIAGGAIATAAEFINYLT